MKRSGSAACGMKPEGLVKVTVVVAGVKGVPVKWNKKPSGVAIEVEGVAGLTKRPAVLTGSHTMTCTFNQSFDTQGRFEKGFTSIRLRLLGSDRIFGKTIIKIPEDPDQGKPEWHQFPFGGEVQVSYQHNKQTRPHTAEPETTPTTTTSTTSTSVAPTTVSTGTGTLQLRIISIESTQEARTECNTVVLVCTFSRTEKSTPSYPLSARIDADFNIDYDMVPGDENRVLHLALWGYQEPRSGAYGGTLLGDSMFDATQGSPQTASFSGFKILFCSKVFIQRPLQEGSTGRPKSAYPKKFKTGVIRMRDDTSQVVSKEASLSADEVKMDFSSEPTAVHVLLQDLSVQLSNVQTSLSQQISTLHTRVASIEAKVTTLMSDRSPEPSSCSSPPPLRCVLPPDT